MNTAATDNHYQPADVTMRHRLPPLHYAVDALEPCIDARTMTLHRNTHHAGYVDKLNAAVAGLPTLEDASALWLLCNLNQVPRESRATVHHNAGGHVNHSLFWQTMTPGSAGRELFGSGWVWLVAPRGAGGELEIMTTAGHDNPEQKGLVPLLLNDVWEHAYYLRYQGRRAEYLRAWWTVVDWTEASRRLEDRDRPAAAR